MGCLTLSDETVSMHVCLGDTVIHSRVGGMECMCSPRVSRTRSVCSHVLTLWSWVLLLIQPVSFKNQGTGATSSGHCGGPVSFSLSLRGRVTTLIKILFWGLSASSDRQQEETNILLLSLWGKWGRVCPVLKLSFHYFFVVVVGNFLIQLHIYSFFQQIKILIELFSTT